MDKTSKLCTVKGDDIDPIQIVRKLRMLCHVEIVAVERPKEPEKKEEELEKEMVEVVNASSLAAAVIGPSKEPKKKEEELEKEEPEKKKEEMVEVVNASSLAAAIGPSKEPKKKEDQLEKREPTKQEEKKKGEEIITDVKEDPNETFRAGAMEKAVFKMELCDEITKTKAMKSVSRLAGVDSISMDRKDKKMTVKAVLKLDLHDDKDKIKAMRRVSGLPGVDSISMDMKDKKLTVIGDIDAVCIVGKLRKICHTEIISVGPAKEPEKKKEEPGEHYEDPVPELVQAYKSYNPQMGTYCYVTSAEENPNACGIC